MNQAARRILCAAAGAVCFALAACAGAPRKAESPRQAPTRVDGGSGAAHASSSRRRSPYAPAQEDLSKRGDYTAGGLYAPGVADSAPTDGIPDVDEIPEPEVRDEPHSRYGNRSPYTVLGKTYRVLDNAEGYDEVGTASFYGNKFHGRRTSNLEVYDMYAFTAAHKTLPLPSFARVTNLANGRSVVVRVNDRGPFHDGRIIDLSYAAAVKLGVDRAGTARVEVRGLMPGEDAHVGYDALASAATVPVPPSPAAAKPAPLSSGADDVADDDVVAEPLPPTAIDRLVAALPIAAADASGSLTFQVATFADRANADRALASVNRAGIAGARLEDGASAGRPVWRLRIGPVAPAAAAELAARLQGLGFGPLQRVPQ